MKMKNILNLIILTLGLTMVSVRSLADNTPTAIEKVLADLSDFSSMKKKMDRHPNDIKLQEEAITTLGHAASRIYTYDNLNKNKRIEIPDVEKAFIFYMYSKILIQLRPHHVDIHSFASHIFDYTKNAETYDVKLIQAEARLMTAEFETNLPNLIHRLRLIRNMLVAMEKDPVSLAPGVEQYRRWTQLDVSNANRLKLLKRIDSVLNSFSADIYYETANTMLNYWLWRDEIKLKTHDAKQYYDTYVFAKEKDETMGYPDANCPLARLNEHDGDKDMAFFLYKTAAKAGGIDGKLNVARLIIEGYGSPNPNYAEALGLLKKSQDHPLFSNRGGLALLGRMYENGLGIDKNDSMAFKYYTKAYESMRLQKGLVSYSNYESKRLKEDRLKLESLNKDINRVLYRMDLRYIEKETKQIDPKRMTPNIWLMLAFRYYLIGNETLGSFYMNLAAEQGNQDAIHILKWKARSPEYSVKSIIKNVFK